MTNFMIDINDKRIFVRAATEEMARKYICKEFPNDARTPFLGWCTDEVANEIGYEIYYTNTTPLTIEDFYKWAVENRCEDYALFAFDSNGLSHDRFTLNDLTIYRDDQQIFIF